MSCISLHKGQDLSCGIWVKKYYQQLVLINKDDVNNFNTLSKRNEDGTFRHRIQFDLKAGKTGYRFQGAENGTSFNARFSKQIVDNIPQYLHELQLPILGASEETKYIIKTLDYANYFATIQLMDGKVEVYGFENGLTTGDYTFDLQGNMGGSFIPLESKDLEDEPPYIYYSLTPLSDFDELFANVNLVALGDFNDDFNNDFYTL